MGLNFNRHTVRILATIVATHTHPPRVISTLRFVEQNGNTCIHVHRLAKRIGSMSCPPPPSLILSVWTITLALVYCQIQCFNIVISRVFTVSFTGLYSVSLFDVDYYNLISTILQRHQKILPSSLNSQKEGHFKFHCCQVQDASTLTLK